MSRAGENDGIRVLDDFECEAIRRSDLDTPVATARGVNANMGVMSELTSHAAPVSAIQGNLATLRAMSSAELLVRLQSSRSTLSRQELLAIHDIALERIAGGPDDQAAKELSRNAMLAAFRTN